ncbi:MAG: undecaprenyldiphospho-muramoylpentapeptide beta-N-acetylglucosaminyltransferase [Gammaproteobacteria bacterium]|nr:undecaprenyldiphospho-muramoylpentapeptide beta-N-acetylglucosaminyltransferase [Gammaproteobacteria bacterium]
MSAQLTTRSVKRILVMAGGTGGHVFPALAVADELRTQGVEVVWMGTRAGLEADVVPRAGYDMEWVSISGLRGKGALSLLLAPFKLAAAMMQALAIVMRRRPMAVLGMGGFVTGPGGLVTRLLHKPLVIHEQNAIAGMTNRWLARLASKVLEAFPGTFPASSGAIATGNPVREAIAALPPPEQRMAGRVGPLRLLVVGGSLGAQVFNQVVPEAVRRLPRQKTPPEIWHQAGKRNIDAARECYQKAGVTGRVEPFIDDMAAAYAWADLVLCRAGALTVSELAAAGVASILVPYPFAVDDHQTHNAAYLSDTGAALRVPQGEFTVDKLSALLADFCQDAGQGRQRLLEMARAARAKAKPESTREVAAWCMRLMEQA